MIRTKHVLWENEYLFAINNDNKPQCFVCYRTLDVLKKHNIQRHYETMHQHRYSHLVGEVRKNVVGSLKEIFQKKMAQEATQTTIDLPKSALKASYVASYNIAKQNKHFSEGEFIKQVTISMLECFGEKGKEFVEYIESVPLSQHIVESRIKDIEDILKNQVQNMMQDAEYYSIAISENIDLANTSQMLVCVRTINRHFGIHEELLKLVSFPGNTSGKDIFERVQMVLSQFGGFGKLSSVCTDGSTAMVDEKEGFIAQLKKNYVQVPTFNCVKHQEELFAKSFTKMQKTMTAVLQTINHMLDSKKNKFPTFIKEIAADIGDGKAFTDVRWLSRGRCLQNFFDLRDEIILFLEYDVANGEGLLEQIKDPKFMSSLAFLADITKHLNSLDIHQQSETNNIFSLIATVDGFRTKLNLLISYLKVGNLDINFSNLQVIVGQDEQTDYRIYIAHIEDLQNEIDKRFGGFEVIRTLMPLYFNPMKCDITSQEMCFHMELADLQSDPVLTNTEKSGIDFWKMVSHEKYTNIVYNILRVCSMFGSTYTCERNFSKLRQIQAQNLNNVSGDDLEDLLRLSTTKLDVDFYDLAK